MRGQSQFSTMSIPLRDAGTFTAHMAGLETDLTNLSGPLVLVAPAHVLHSVSLTERRSTDIMICPKKSEILRGREEDDGSQAARSTGSLHPAVGWRRKPVRQVLHHWCGPAALLSWMHAVLQARSRANRQVVTPPFLFSSQVQAQQESSLDTTCTEPATPTASLKRNATALCSPSHSHSGTNTFCSAPLQRVHSPLCR